MNDEVILLPNGFWLINGNYFSNKFCKNEEEAKRYAKTLVNCFGCVDCVNCKNCSHCVECNGCQDCEHCHWCNNCNKCSHCRNCNHCDKCIYCSMCSDCAECNLCENYFFNYKYANHSTIYGYQYANMQLQQSYLSYAYNNAVPVGFLR